MEPPGPQGTTKEKLGFRAKMLAERQRNCSFSVSDSCQTNKTWAEVASQVAGENDTMESETRLKCAVKGRRSHA